jgi:glutamate-1-semialdehyde 2,1-aminomutase
MSEAPINWWQLVTGHNFARDVRLRHALIDRGIYYFPAPTKQGSVSFAHSDLDIDRTIRAFDEAISEVGTA